MAIYQTVTHLQVVSEKQPESAARLLPARATHSRFLCARRAEIENDINSSKR